MYRLACFIVLTLLANFAWAEPSRVEMARQEFLKAQSFEQAGVYGYAVNHYLASLQWQERYAPAYRQLGNCYYHLGRFQDALDAYRRSLALQPDAGLQKFVDWLQSTRHIHLTLRDKRELWGPWLAEDHDHLRLKAADGKEVSVDKADIWFREDFLPEKVASTDLSFEKKTYPYVGLEFGTLPISLVAGYSGEHFGIRLGGGYFGAAGWGVQLNVSGKVYEKNYWTQEVLFYGGASDLAAYGQAAQNPELYFGAGYGVSWHGIELQAGLVWNEDERYLMPLMLQIGYLYKFN